MTTPRPSGASYLGASNDAVYASLAAAGGILRIPHDGSQAANLFIGETYGLTVDATHVYFAASDSIDILPKAGGCPQHLAIADEPVGVTSDDSAIYFIDNRGQQARVKKVSKIGGAVTVLADGEAGAHAIAVDATSVYWNNAGDGTIMKTAK